MDAIRLLLSLRSAPWLIERSLGPLVADGITLMKAAVLREIEASPGIRPSQISAAIRQKTANTQLYLKQMVSEGLITRERLGRNRTATHLTEKGLTALTEMRCELEFLAESIWEGLPASDIAAAGRVMARLMERTL